MDPRFDNLKRELRDLRAYMAILTVGLVVLAAVVAALMERTLR